MLLSPGSRSASSATRDCRSVSVTTTFARDNRSACSRKSPLLAAFTAAATAPMRPGAQPEVDPFRAGRGEQRDAVTRSDTQVQQRISRGAGPLPHLLEGHLSTGDRHHHPVGILLGTTIEHGRDAEPIDTEISWTDGLSVACGCRPSRHAGHRAPQPGRRVGLTVGGVAEVFRRALLARVEAVRPASQRRVVVRLFGCEIRLLQVLHVLPGEEVLFDDFLLQRQELGGAAGGHVTGVTGLTDGSLGVEVVGVVLVDRRLAGDLDGGHQVAGEANNVPVPASSCRR